MMLCYAMPCHDATLLSWLLALALALVVVETNYQVLVRSQLLITYLRHAQLGSTVIFLFHFID